MPSKSKRKKPSFTKVEKFKGKLLKTKPANMSPAQFKALSTVSVCGAYQGVTGFRSVSYKVAGMEHAE